MKIRNVNSGVVVNLPDDRAEKLVASKAYEPVAPAKKPAETKPQRRTRKRNTAKGD